MVNKYLEHSFGGLQQSDVFGYKFNTEQGLEFRFFNLLNLHCLRHGALLLQSINHDHNNFIMKFVFQKAAIPIANCLGQVKMLYMLVYLIPQLGKHMSG